jgi:hypothetical protein
VELKTRSSSKVNAYTDAEGLALETYAYLALVSQICPNAAYMDRLVADDDFLFSLQWLRKYPSFGTFFSHGVDLFEMIPVVNQLARERMALWRLARLQDGSKRNTLAFDEAGSARTALELQSSMLQKRAQRMADYLSSWKSPPVPAASAGYELEHRLCGEVYRTGLLVFLDACCLEYSDQDVIVAPGPGSEYERAYPRPSPVRVAEIQRLVDARSFFARKLIFSPYGCTILWPTIIASSCITDPARQKVLLDSTTDPASPFANHPLVLQVAQVLRLLWNDERQLYGPFGLELIMKRHEINLSMA